MIFMKKNGSPLANVGGKQAEKKGSVPQCGKIVGEGGPRSCWQCA
jgi:hypothetical protein